MRTALCLALFMPLLAAQDPAPAGAPWFGPEAALTPVKPVGEAWRRPDLDLRGRRIQVLPWVQVQWPGGPPRGQDEVLAARLAPSLAPALAKGLGRGLKGQATAAADAGDCRMEGRLLDARGGTGDPHAFRQTVEGTFEVRLVDRGGAVLAAFRERLEAQDADFLGLKAADWFEALGRHLASATPAARASAPAPPVPPVPAAVPPTPKAVAPPVQGAPAPAAVPRNRAEVLAAIETLRREGLLSEAEAQALRRRVQQP